MKVRYQKILKNDVLFFQKCKIMDYSLLLGIFEDIQEGKYIYKFGIIDYLGTFGIMKHGEIMWKTTFKKAKRVQLSAMHSDPYGNRFLNFMSN